ncbi:MAG: CoA-binding protein [Candidatus Helarchaeota archaeon]|nr:CoA-binding protein [Candidatus Helarchaeota archaeon]
MDDSLFNPRSVAVVGASPHFVSGGTFFLRALLAAEFPKERLFPINPKHEEMYGLKVYPSLQSVPHPVDYVIVIVPKDATFKVMEDCVEKKVKLVSCFTSGFSEIGNKEDERRLISIAKKGGVRVLGPNCMGLCVPKNRLVFDTGIESGEEWAGNISIISQSGGNADVMIIIGNGIGLKFNKAVSYGNGSDINADELLEYFKNDPQTNIILQYLEGFKTIEQGRNYLKTLRETTLKKPVIIFQGGTTAIGKRSIFSHTGSISGDNRVIEGAFKQAGAIMVKQGLHHLLYTALLISCFQKSNKLFKVGPNLGTILGGGGNNVYVADICSKIGLNFPAFDEEMNEWLKKNVGEVGTVLGNPIDMNAGMSGYKTAIKIMKLMDKIDQIDVITYETDFDWWLVSAKIRQKLDLYKEFDFKGLMESIMDTNVKTLIRNIKKIQKPVILISSQTFYDADIVSKRNELEETFRKADIPIINDMATMATVLKYLIDYKEYILRAK